MTEKDRSGTGLEVLQTSDSRGGMGRTGDGMSSLLWVHFIVGWRKSCLLKLNWWWMLQRPIFIVHKLVDQTCEAKNLVAGPHLVHERECHCSRESFQHDFRSQKSEVILGKCHLGLFSSW